jgi:group II intron reverse transcriptase/maturase
MIPNLLTATSVFIIAFFAAPPVDIDGIREPVSGSLLYGNNISAPRSFAFRHEKWTDSNLVRTAPSLLPRGNLLGGPKPAGKTLDESSLHGSVGRELRILWLKLYCLKLKSGTLASQIESVFSYKHVVVGVNHFKESQASMMCACVGCILGSTLLSVKRSNEKPKGFMPNNLTIVGIRRSRKTLGSPSHKQNRIKPVRVTNGDGDAVRDNDLDIPKGPWSDPKDSENQSQRASGGTSQDILNASRMEDASNPNKIADRWEVIERRAQGVKVPKKLEKISEICKRNTSCKINDIYPLLLDPAMYDLAYGQIKSNPGNMTMGADGSTLDGWGQEKIDTTIQAMRNESFQFAPSRMVEIPKPQGGVRGIKVAPPTDKVVQRIITYILEAIFDPSFSEFSFGFRSNLGCHDALKHVQLKFQGARWFVEGDISKCFDEIDHNMLIETIRERISDERFVRLIWKALRAGYLDVWKTPQNCLVGTPQGSIVSPILCNIFMNKFDRFVENELIPEYTKGKSRRVNPVYNNLNASSRWFFSKYSRTRNPLDLRTALARRNCMQNMPSTDTNDPNFRRLYYVRYADDWLIGFAGSYREAQSIRERCKEFLAGMKLRLNEEKTVISSAQKGCIFLGTKIHVPLNQLVFKRGTKHKARANLGVRLNAPLERAIKKLSLAGYCDVNGVAKPRMALYAADKDEIVGIYSAVARGILNYYSFSDNRRRLSQSVFHILRGSLAKLLAAKFKLRTARQAIIKFGKYLNGDSDISFPAPNELVKNTPVFKLGKKDLSSVDALFVRASLTIKASSLACANCASTHKVEMHHVRFLKDLNNKMDPISRAMAARRRKQIPLCRSCHMHKHEEIRKIAKGIKTARADTE